MRPSRALLLAPLVLLAAVVLAQPPAPTPAPEAKLSLKGHLDPVYGVAASADGKRFATASFDKTVKVWDASTGKELRTFGGKAGHQNLVTAVAFSPDGSSVVSASTDNTARVWDVPTGKPVIEFDLAAGGTKVAGSADGKLFAVGAADGSTKLYTAAENKNTFTLAVPNSGAVLGLGFAPNGANLYTLTADKVLRYWTTADGKPAGAVGATAGEVSGFWVNPANGVPTVASADGVLAFFPAAAVAAPKPLPVLTDAATAFALSGDGTIAVVATADKKVKAIKTADGAVVYDVPLPAAATRVSANANGTLAAVVVGTQLHLLAADGKPRAVLAVDPLLDVQFSTTLPQFVTLSTSGIARTWAIPPAPLALKPMVQPDMVKAVTLSADGKKVITAGADKVVRVSNAGAVEREYKEHTAAVVAVAIATDNVVSADVEGGVLFWNPADGKQAAKLAGPKKAVAMLAVVPGTKTVAVAYADGEVRLYAAPTTAEKDAKSFAHPKAILAAVFAADNKRPVTACADGKVRFLNPDTGKEEGAFDLTAKDKVAAVAFSADRTKFAEAGGGFLSVRALPDGKPVFSVAFADTATAIGWSADAKTLAVAATVGAKQVVKAFDAATGAELQTVAEPAAAVRAVQFLPDNKTLLVGGDDKQLTPADVWVMGVRATADKPLVGVLAPTLTTAVVGTADKTVRTFETAVAPAAKEIKPFPGLPTDAKAVAVSKDTGFVAAVSGKTLKAWTTADAKEVSLAVLPADGTLVAFNADRSRLAVALADNTAVVIAMNTGRIEQVVRHAGPVVGVAFHPALPVLFTASADKTVQASALFAPRLAADSGRFGKAFTTTGNGASTISTGAGKGITIANANSSAVERTVGEAVGITVVATNKAVTQLAAFNPTDGTITVHNYADGAAVGNWKPPAAVVQLAYHPTLNAVVAVLADNRVMAWNTTYEAGQPLPPEFGKPSLELLHPSTVKGMAFAGDGLIVTAADDKKARVWKFAADTPSRSLQHPNLVNAVAFDKTGNFIATGGQDGVLRIWDVSKKETPTAKAINAHVPATPAQARPIYSVVWSLDGKQVFTASDDKSIKIWDVTAAGVLVKEIKPGSDKPPTSDAVKAAGPAAFGGLWAAGVSVPPPPGHTDQVYSLTLDKDGKYLASGSADKTVKLWDAKTGELVRTFVNPTLKVTTDSHPGFVQSVKFTPDGTKLVTVGTAPKNKGYVAVWSVADGKLLAGYEMAVGPMYSVDVTADGHAVIGCGPKQARGGTDSEAVVIVLPK